MFSKIKNLFSRLYYKVAAWWMMRKLDKVMKQDCLGCTSGCETADKAPEDVYKYAVVWAVDVKDEKKPASKKKKKTKRSKTSKKKTSKKTSKVGKNGGRTKRKTKTRGKRT